MVYKWAKEFHSGREQLGYWISKQPRGTIKDARVVMSRNNTGQIGISYMKRGAQTIRSLGDYKLFIACKAQEVFKKLVNDTIIQSDHTVTISNMRKAIKDTNVVLNMVISPGIILIPSNLIILDKMIPGYNNVLKLATKGMRFGKNNKVTYFEPSEEPSTVNTRPSSVPSPVNTGSSRVPSSASTRPTSVNTESSPASKELKSVRSKPKMNESELILLIITAPGGTLISKFLI